MGKVVCFRSYATSVLLVALLYGVVMPCGTAVAQSEDAELELQALQDELKARQAALQDSRTDAEALQKVLAESEKQIGAVARKLNAISTSLDDTRQQQQALNARRKELETAIEQQQSLLSGQLKSAFISGNFDYAKMVFYQEDAARFERILTYYKYLNEARQKEITKFKSSVDELEQVNAQLLVKAQELTQLLARQEQQQSELLARQQDRQQTLRKLESKIASDESRIAQLREAEQALVEAIEKAQRESQLPQELTGLTADKGKLLKPADGSLRKLFGKRRQGQVRWKGIMIDGQEGSAVKAVAHGRVIYADWLRGFGLVTIIEHGDGFMSVYGHNQALLRSAGDSVTRGETVALLGQSGGQSSPNLYFEIRHKGKALNPLQWLEI
ncbi:murein hydrolase activator EnvC family protein [Alteromonas gilva]|uniref:Peptidoglycan DD-metalloendopeptidase family protein n=1 Tax=Alteromonas gilva TaxID=2987522 RepID=A0ABT5L5J9_9ALTE|nr:peptidoglycan DD-metalloendopeptidase family protein [Alteromonas gilva]MDC8832142.1 peptidoglycan DD-metalloendopeptidase family protein [Alteromonas gilva]